MLWENGSEFIDLEWILAQEWISRLEVPIGRVSLILPEHDVQRRKPTPSLQSRQRLTAILLAASAFFNPAGTLAADEPDSSPEAGKKALPPVGSGVLLPTFIVNLLLV